MRWTFLALITWLLLTAAVAAQTTTTITWTPSTDSNLAGYVVYRGTSATTYEPVLSVDKGVTRVTIPLPDAATPWLIAVRAVRTDGVIGPRSMELQVTGAATPPLPPSPDGTKAATIVDCEGARWTLGPNGETLRNGQHAGGGFGSTYKLVTCVRYVLGLVPPVWYALNGGEWQSTGSTTEPGTPTQPVPPPPPPPPAPATFSCRVAQQPRKLSGTQEQLTITCPVDTPFGRNDPVVLSKP